MRNGPGGIYVQRVILNNQSWPCAVRHPRDPHTTPPSPPHPPFTSQVTKVIPISGNGGAPGQKTIINTCRRSRLDPHLNTNYHTSPYLTPCRPRARYHRESPYYRHTPYYRSHALLSPNITYYRSQKGEGMDR